MPPIILDGKALAASIRKDLQTLVAEKNLHPCLAILTVGDDPASAVYVRNKKKACDEIGITYRHICLPTDSTTKQVLNTVKGLNYDVNVHGIIVQLPLPSHIDAETVTKAVWRSKDVDGFGQDSLFHPCTPEGIIRLLDHYNTPIESRNVVIIGRSDIVGKPLARMMLDRNANVTILHSKTTEEDRHDFLERANIIVSAVGRPNMVIPNDIYNATIIDVGINRDQNGKLCGDVHPLAYEFSYAYTPVPGGVGPMTVAMLMEHVVQSALWQQEATNDSM